MVDPGLLAQRLRWTRLEQGVTLQQLSERCGRAVSYLSQLEHGVKSNPTKQTVESLAKALGVRPAFLFGEADVQVGCPAPSASAVGQAFRRHFDSLPASERQRLTYAEPVSRFAAVVDFLVERFPEHFTDIELAYQLHISLETFVDLRSLRGEVSSMILLEELARVSGVPLSFFTQGVMEAPPVDTAALGAYASALTLALRRGLTPEQLEALILQVG